MSIAGWSVHGSTVHDAYSNEPRTNQRKITGPAFSAKAVRDLSPFFFEKAQELRSVWDDIITSSSLSHECSVSSDDRVCTQTRPTEHAAKIDVYHWCSRLAFDVMGLAGFDCPFNALKDESEAVYMAFKEMFASVVESNGLMTTFYVYFPILEKILVCSL